MNAVTPTLDPDKVPLGITPTLWWSDDFPSLDIGIPFGQCVSEMALAGFQGCSIGHKYPTDPAVLKSALDLRGLRVTEPWVSTYFTISDMWEQTLQAFHQQMTFIKTMGATDMVVAELGHAVHPLPVALFANCPIFSDRQWSDLCNGLNQLGEIATANGMQLCYHPHMGTGVMVKDDMPAGRRPRSGRRTRSKRPTPSRRTCRRRRKPTRSTSRKPPARLREPRMKGRLAGKRGWCAMKGCCGVRSPARGLGGGATGAGSAI